MNYNILVDSLQIGRRLDFNPETGTFAAVPEAKGKGCRKRAKGETTKHLQAMNRAVNELKTTLNTTNNLNLIELCPLHEGLSKRINYIQSHTTGVIGWIRSLFRGKQETIELKKLGQELLETRSLIHRTQGAAAYIFALKSPEPITNKKAADRALKMVKNEFPELFHSGKVTAKSFGMTAEDPKPKVPFLITKSDSGGYPLTLHMPPHHHFETLDIQVIHHRLNSFANLATTYENYVHLYGRAIENAVNTYLYQSLRLHNLAAPDSSLNGPLRVAIELKLGSNANHPHSILNFSYINPETNQQETEKIHIDLLTTVNEVKAKINSVIQQHNTRVGEIKSFLQQNFKDKNKDANGIECHKDSCTFSFELNSEILRIGKVEIQGLGENSYKKIKELKASLEKNEIYLKANLNKDKSIKINGFEFKFEFNSKTKQILVKDHLGKETYHKFSYADNLEEKLKDLTKILPFKIKTQLSTPVLNSVSPFSEATHIENVPEVSVSKLKEFKDQIDFSGHNLRTANDELSITKEDISNGIDKIVDTIKAYRAGEPCGHYGIPPATAPEERKKYFDALEARLTHIIDALEKPENKALFSEVMINLGVGGNHCGGRWVGEVSKYYSMLCLPQVDEKNIPLDSWLQIRCDQTKQEIVEAMVLEGDGKNTPHIRNRYLKSLKEQGVAVPGYEAAMYNDLFRHHGGGLMKNEDILTRFNSQLDLARFIEESREEINKRIQNFDAAEVCQNFGSQVTNRLQTAIRVILLPHMPKKQKEFEQLTTAQKKNEFLDTLMDDLKLVTTNESTMALNGVTNRGMALLALQTGVINFKKDDLNPLAFIQSV